jgi:hypothetical protein
MMPGSDDYESEPLVEVAVPELVRESSQLRNEAPLNFVSLRSLVDGVGSGALSRVEMNALRAPLTALLSREGKCLFDEADDFIDSDKGISQQLVPAASRNSSMDRSRAGKKAPEAALLVVSFEEADGTNIVTLEPASLPVFIAILSPQSPQM